MNKSRHELRQECLRGLYAKATDAHKRLIQHAAEERKNGVDPEAWMAYYQSNGWKCGRNPMKDWRAAVITWEKREAQQQKPKRYNGTGRKQSFTEMVEALGREMGVPPKAGEDWGPYYARLQDIQRRAH